MLYIKGVSPDGIIEIIDECNTIQEAVYLVGEYKMAFGDRWDIWYE